VLKARGEAWSRPVSGGFSERETPLPIPNRAVKPLSADGTWPARAWESRTPPVFSYERAPNATSDRGSSSFWVGVRPPGGRQAGPAGDQAAAEAVVQPVPAAAASACAHGACWVPARLPG